jgi:hypothetical protein
MPTTTDRNSQKTPFLQPHQAKDAPTALTWAMTDGCEDMNTRFCLPSAPTGNCPHRDACPVWPMGRQTRDTGTLETNSGISRKQLSSAGPREPATRTAEQVQHGSPTRALRSNLLYTAFHSCFGLLVPRPLLHRCN